VTVRLEHQSRPDGKREAQNVVHRFSSRHHPTKIPARAQ